MKNTILKNLHVFIFLYAFWGFFNIYEQKTLEIETEKQETPVLESKITKAQRKLKEINKFKKNLEVSKERVKEVVKQIEKIQKQLPADVNDAQVQELIGGIASKLKIKDPSPSAGKEALNGFYFAKDYNFSGKGTFLQFLIFFENLAKAERILNVKQLAFNYVTEDIRSRFQVLKMNAVVESFRYNKKHKEKVDGID